MYFQDVPDPHLFVTHDSFLLLQPVLDDILNLEKNIKYTADDTINAYSIEGQHIVLDINHHNNHNNNNAFSSLIMTDMELELVDQPVNNDVDVELVDQPANDDVAVVNDNDNFNTYGPTYISDGIDNEKNEHDEFNNNNNNANFTITNSSKDIAVYVHAISCSNNVYNFTISDEVNNCIANIDIFIVNLGNNNVDMGIIVDDTNAINSVDINQYDTSWQYNNGNATTATDDSIYNNDVANGDLTLDFESDAVVVLVTDGTATNNNNADQEDIVDDSAPSLLLYNNIIDVNHVVL